MADLDRAETIRDYFGNPIHVKTAFRLLKEEAMTHSLADYARISGNDDKNR